MQINDLKQKRNELSIQLSSSDFKVIPHDIIQHLLETYIQVFQHSSREKQKLLFQLLINAISIKFSTGRSRAVNQIELDFDFSQINLSKTFMLIHILYLESGKEEQQTASLPDSIDKKPAYLHKFLPLFMVRFPVLL